MNRKLVLIATAAVALAAPAIAQMTAPAPAPVVRAAGGTLDVSQITAGTYAVDTNHTQVVWTANHLGFNAYTGIFGGATGSLTIDPAHPAGASVSIDIPLASVATTRQGLTDHLMKPDFFDVANHPVATFRSTAVTVDGTKAKIAGNLTLRGVTRPIVLDAHFTGAGNNPMNKKATIGFEGTAVIKRTDFGIMYGLPGVGEMVDLRISAAFEKSAA
ncbi:MAG TPA: YceI family protein [Novosphingobium sp.]|nr:YceI family protein [Novosphingobium sp.]